jgi:CubicO group peptidase (beta-lactamase class C family)
VSEALGQAVRRRVLRERVEARLPGLAVAVGHAGEAVCVAGAGVSDVASGRPVDDGTQYRIGSVTKTFTAALVVLLAERGLLDLDAPVEAYLPGTGVGRPLIRQLLAHCGGVQREAPLPMWATMTGPDATELLAALARAEMVDQPGVRWHYSNLGYAVLGLIVQHVTGHSCEELIERELLAPLGLTGTAWQPGQGAASGYRLDPYDDTVHPEPVMQQGAIGVGGQLWSTAPDLLTWGHALIGGAPDVLPAPVIAAMHTPHVMVDRRRWTQGWGLGLILDRREDRVLSGHTGAMPGFLAALSLDQDSQTVVAALTNVTRGARLTALAADLLHEAQHHLPAPSPQWSPAPSAGSSPCPESLTGVLGRWWCESEETVFTWRHGALHAYLADSPASSDSVFVPDGPDRYRVDHGRLQGERLHVLRDVDGAVRQLEWATYPYTRTPR